MNKSILMWLSFCVAIFLLVMPFSSRAQALPAAPNPRSLGWMRLADTPALHLRGARAVYDSARGVVVLFGGESFGYWSDQTWEYDHDGWQQVLTPVSPPGRIWHGLAYDSNRQKVLLFGGVNDDLGGNLFDTWEYDGTTWTQLAPANVPSATYGFGMTYDSCRERVALFSGNEDPTTTWEFFNGNWQPIVTLQRPGGAGLTALVFDTQRCKAVLFGGFNNETWEYDGAWTHINPAHRPIPRWAHALAYDPQRGKVVLFGGYGPSFPDGSALNDTWEYDGVDWVETSPAFSPSPREQHAMTYEPHSGQVLLHGGFDNGETWLYGLQARLFLPMLGRFAYQCSDRPLLVWPHNGQTIPTLIPEYRWDTCDIPGAIEVDLRVSPNPDMSNWVLGLASFPTGMSSFRNWENLKPNTTYYWAIRARFSNDDYGPASTGSFRTAGSGLILPAPVLISPANNAVLPGKTVTFQWQPVSGAEVYQVRVGWDEPYGSSMTIWDVYTTEATFSYLPANTKCWWTVASVTSYAIGPASEKRTFTSGP